MEISAASLAFHIFPPVFYDLTHILNILFDDSAIFGNFKISFSAAAFCYNFYDLCCLPSSDFNVN